ncbi:MAG TPA: serine hydrolase domain-containing protein [Gemmatimonadaceae bacterium]|nr:serine hydrolase domain-containing protein [Gemmatimonadaceae bacterium]
MRTFSLLLAAFVAAPLLAQAPAFPSAAPQAAGFDAARLERLARYLQETVDSGQTAGAVLVVARDGRVVFERAVGQADRESRRAMTPATLFRIASQTKALTSVAVMQLVEEGRIALGDPVSRWIPGFGAAGVVTMVDSSGTRVRRASPLRRAITIRDLLTHTAGLSYGGEEWVREQYVAQGLGPAAGSGWYFADKTEPICASIDRLAKLPVVTQPGERFVYGYATDVLGCVVERAGGASLAEAIRTRITEPLGMRDTRFCVPEAERARLATVYMHGPGGLARAPEGARGQGHYVAAPCVAFSGGAGLVSTARDYARFLAALENGGALGGARILAPATVALMTHDHLGETYGQPGRGFGLGFEVFTAPARAARYGGAGQYGWGGAYASTYWVDPETGIVAAFMTQLLPGNAGPIHERVRALVHGAVVK